MDAGYALQIQTVRLSGEGRFQVRIGLLGDREIEFIPAYRSAFATRVPLRIAHWRKAAAESELKEFQEWLDLGANRGPQTMRADEAVTRSRPAQPSRRSEVLEPGPPVPLPDPSAAVQIWK